MNATDEWVARLRFRLEDFRATEVPGRGRPWSVKVRSTGWRFDRVSAPGAFAVADRWLRDHPRASLWLLDHSTGPEVLCFGHGLEEACVIDPLARELVGVVVRSARAAAADRRHAGVAVILRGFGDSGAYVEKTLPWAGSEAAEGSDAAVSEPEIGRRPR